MLRSGRMLALAVLCALVLRPVQTRAAELYGVEFPHSLQVRDVKLELAGLGLLRQNYFMKVYVAALYLAEGIEPDHALDDVPKRLEFEYEYSITAGELRRTTIEAIEYQNGTEAVERFGAQIEALNALYRSVDPGDRIAVTYLPATGIEVAFNGLPQGVVEGADFARTFFAIWLSKDKPLNADLRDQLLHES